MRRSADAIKTPTYVEDKDSGELRRPHHLDLKTGMYKGRQVLKAKKRVLIGLRRGRRGMPKRRSRFPIRCSNNGVAPEFGQRVRSRRARSRRGQ